GAQMSSRNGEANKPARDLRLPGSVAEIMASPPGPKIGAFFDLDGTLVAGFTAIILTQERLRRRDMGVGELISMVTAGLNHQIGRIEFEELIGKAASVQKFAGENGIDLKDSYFYADGDEDVALMYLVGNPRPTNPEGKMAA